MIMWTFYRNGLAMLGFKTLKFHGNDTLFTAARYGKVHAVSKILDLGCDATYQEPLGLTALKGVYLYRDEKIHDMAERVEKANTIINL
jgi:hypothetical protein